MRKGWVVIAGSVNNDSKPWKINGPTVRRDGVHGSVNSKLTDQPIAESGSSFGILV